MGLMMLSAGMGSQISIKVSGPDAEPAMIAMLALIEAKFGEE
jgi:phosphotransferase system HPr-like phosphotransfer protein